MNNSFLKKLLGITALVVMTTNCLKSAGIYAAIYNGDYVYLRPTSHSQGYTLEGHKQYQEDVGSGEWQDTGNYFCGLGQKTAWHISNTQNKDKVPLNYGDTITLKSHCNHTDNGFDHYMGGYLSARSADEGYSVNANQKNAYDWEIWTLVNPDNDKDTSPIPNQGKVALRSTWGRYLCGKPDKNIIADREAIGAWETWTIAKE